MKRFITIMSFSSLLILFISCYSKSKMNEIYGEVFALEDHGEYQKAKELLDSVPKFNRDWNYYLNYGLCVRNQDPSFWSGISAPYFLKAYNLNPDNFETTYFFAQTNRYMGIDNAAYDLFIKAETLPDCYNFFSLYYELADVCLKLGKNAEAVNYIQKCLEIEKTSYLIMMEGIAISRRDSIDCLDEYYEKADFIDDDKTLMKHLYGKEELSCGRFSKALPIYEDLIKNNPTNSTYYAELAKICLVQKKYDLALEYLNTAFKLNWNDKECLKNFSLYYYSQGDIQESLNYANRYFQTNTILNIELKSEADLRERFKRDIRDIAL
nr:tetratricopeptide repeat protein [Treponema sp.]